MVEYRKYEGGMIMRKIICLLLCAVLLCGCGGLKEQNAEELEKEMSDLYATEELKTISRDNVSFQMPDSWTASIKIDKDWMYYYFDDSLLGINIRDGNEFRDNETFLSQKDGFIEGMLERSNGELISDEVIDISGEKALETVLFQTVDGKKYRISSITFIYDSEFYNLGWVILGESNIDYSKDYEKFKESIRIENHEENDETGFPTSWKLLSELKSANKNLTFIETFNKDTDPNGTEMGSEGFYITKASYFDSRVNPTLMNEYAGTIETFRTEEDCLKRAEYLRSLDGPDSGEIPTNQYIYQNGKVLFRVNKELSEIQAEEYNDQLIEIIKKYAKNKSKENKKETESGKLSKDSTPTTGQRNALDRAKSYLNYSNFSYQGLIEQLKYDKFSEKEATYAVDNCGADWNEQALGKAKNYLSHSAFSYTGLIEQLEYEKFTAEQATYATDNCGADWNKQAANKAKSYLSHSSFSREGLIEQLEYEGFTHEQAIYGVEQNGY